MSETGSNESQTIREDPDPRSQRFHDAYLMMAADARYRPAAPGDGFGPVLLSEAQAHDPVRLEQEACKYAGQFAQDDEREEHWTGCTNYDTNRAFVFVIEAARALCSGSHDQSGARPALHGDPRGYGRR
jgi:hypothetical protein